MNDDGASAPLLSDTADIEAREAPRAEHEHEHEPERGRALELEYADEPAIPLKDRRRATLLLAASDFVTKTRFLCFAILWPAMYAQLGRDVVDLLAFQTLFTMTSTPVHAFASAITAFGLNPRRVLVLALAAWSVTLCAIASARSMGSVLALQAVLGVFGACIDAAASSLRKPIAALTLVDDWKGENESDTGTEAEGQGASSKKKLKPPSIGYVLAFQARGLSRPLAVIVTALGLLGSWRVSVYMFAAAAAAVALLIAALYPSSAVPRHMPTDGVLFDTEKLVLDDTPQPQPSRFMSLMEGQSPRVVAVFRAFRLVCAALVVCALIALSAVLAYTPITWRWFLELFFVVVVLSGRRVEPLFRFTLHTRHFWTWFCSGLSSASTTLFILFASWLAPLLASPDKNVFAPSFNIPQFWYAVNQATGTVIATSLFMFLRPERAVPSMAAITAVCACTASAMVFKFPATVPFAFILVGVAKAVLTLLWGLGVSWRASLIGGQEKDKASVFKAVIAHTDIWISIMSVASLGLATRLFKFTLRHVPRLDPNSTLPAAASPVFPQFPKDVHDQITGAMAWVFLYAGVLAAMAFLVFMAAEARPLGAYSAAAAMEEARKRRAEAAEAGEAGNGGAGEVKAVKDDVLALSGVP